MNKIAQPSGYFAGPPVACAATTCGYQEFVPGLPLTANYPAAGQCATVSSTSCTTPAVAAPAADGKGWIVDAAGGLTFPSGDWSFRVKTTLTPGTCSSASPPCVTHLAVGMWKVTTGPFATVQTVVDPTGAGENGTNIASGAQTTTTTVTGVPAFSLGVNEHLYVQFWRRQITTMNGGNANRQATLFADDSIAAITAHPTPDGYPSPALASPADGLRTNNTTPTLSASFGDPETLDTGTTTFQYCSDSSCNSPIATSSAIASSDAANATWAPGTLSDGTYYWRVHAEDAAEAALSVTSPWTTTHSFVIDTVKPGVPALGSPSSGAYTSSSSLSATFSDTDAGDSGTIGFQVCTNSSCSNVVASGTSSTVANNASASWTISPAIADGNYYFEARATDAAGNQSNWSSSRAFTLDTTPADTSISTKPVDPTNVTTANFTFTGSDNLSTTGSLTYECKLDTGAFGSCTSPASYTSLSEGSHTFQVRATDQAGNTDASPAPYTWTVDTTAPHTSITSAPLSLSNTAAPSFGIASDETGSTFACSIDNGAFTACTNPKSYSGLSDGSHTLKVKATDPAGNTDATGASYTWTIDTTPPQTTLGTPLPASPTDVTSASFSFTSEAGATFQCSLDAAAFTACTSPQSYSSLVDGGHTFQVRAVDAAGNIDPSPSTFTWVVDTGAPVTTIDSTPGARSNDRSPSFAFSANEAVTGFECSVDGAAFSSCSSPYQPSGLGDGSHTFSVRAAADMAGNPGSAVSFRWTVDTTPPGTPVPTGPADAVWTAKAPGLTATFVNPDASDVGTTEFRVCTKPSRTGSACSPEVAHGNSASALDGGTTSWTVDALLADGVYYWQARSWDQAGNHSDWSATQSFTLDAAAPALPQLGTADGVRARVAPHLTATFFDPSPGDKGTVDFELCSDDACTTVVAHGSAAAAASGKTVTWTIPGRLADGTYFFRVSSEDAVQNGSGWTPSRRLVIDTSTPSVPTPSSPADGALTNSAGLTAAFLDPDLDDAGELLFRLCADPGCRIVIASGSTDPVGNGSDASWTPARLRDGHFFWQVAARDAAGNQSAWSDASAFVLDRKPPKTPRRFSGKIVGGKLVLRWSTPDGGAPHAYMLLVDGVKSEVMPGNASSMTIGPFDPSDTRDFTLEAMDAAGNASRPTQSLVAVPNVIGMTLEDASAVLAKRGLVLARQAKKTVAGPAVVIAQRPSVPAVVVKGTHIAVFAANRVGAHTRRHR